MGQQQSKDELLHQQVSYGNTEGIKALHREGAGLEYVDREGKTPLVAACMNPTLYNVAKTLIELGANVNAYRPGCHGGTPLHHAAKRGLESMIKLLLSHGANALLMNDDCQTPLEVARAKGFSNVVRIIESHICLYSGWLRELYGPGFLEVLAPQLLSRKVWVVVVPCGSRNLRKPFKLELAIYASDQMSEQQLMKYMKANVSVLNDLYKIGDAQPRTTISLWRANMEEPAFNQPDPAVIISEASTISRRGRRRRCRPRHVSQTVTRIKLAPVSESDKQQLRQFCGACKGFPQVMHSNFPFNTSAPIVPATAPPTATEDVELARAINASLQSAMQESLPLGYSEETSGTSSSVSNQYEATSTKGSCIEQAVEEAGPSGTSATTNDDTRAPMPMPSAPAVTDEVIHDGPIQYPSIDFGPVDMSGPLVEKDHLNNDGSKNGGSSSTCVICFDAPVEGACVPCGHMAGCMSCLNEIKDKKWGCPVCRTTIEQVIRVYSV